MLIQILILLFLCNAPQVVKNAPGKGIEKTLSSLPKGTGFSISVLDADKNLPLYENNPALILKPASNIKLFTTGAALLYLGKDFKIRTSIYFDKNKIKNGKLYGDVFLKGFGNAGLSKNDLESFADCISSCGITIITGGIKFDNSFFQLYKSRKDHVSSLTPLDLPTISPISINNNIIKVSFDEKTDKRNMITSPSSKYIACESTLEAGKKTTLAEKQNGISIILNQNEFNSNIKDIYFFIKNPGFLASILLKESLEKKGIIVTGECTPGIVPGNLYENSLFTDLSEFIKETNMNSNNYYAESLKKIFEEYYRTKNKNEIVKDPVLSFLKSRGISTDKLRLADGSGISLQNRGTSKSLVELLKMIYDKPELLKIFKSSLSVAGINGTLKKRFEKSSLKNNFHGKSGFMSGVSSISGYLRTKSGKNVIMALIINYNRNDIGFYENTEKKILEMIYEEY